MLIAVEGLHGAGKSTLIQLLSTHLREKNESVIVSKWNSDEYVSPFVNQLRREGNLNSPMKYFMYHLCDFAQRYETIILPALKRGEIVIADRYIYSGICRGIVRGIPQDFAVSAYSFAKPADCIIYLDISPSDCLLRHTPQSDRSWMIGMNSTPSPDKLDLLGYVSYLEKLQDEYKNHISGTQALILDARMSEYDVFQMACKFLKI